jgi:hypothetical protein
VRGEPTEHQARHEMEFVWHEQVLVPVQVPVQMPVLVRWMTQ